MSKINRKTFLRNSALGLLGSSIAQTSIENLFLTDKAYRSDLSRKSLQNELLLDPKLVYMNTGSLGPSPKVVFNKVIEATRKLEMNPVVNNWGELGKEADQCREEIAQFINADVDEIFLCRNTTEGMNIIASGLDLRAGDEVLTTTDEHHGGVCGWQFLEKYHKIKIRRIDLPKDNLTKAQVIDLVRKNINSNTKVCSFMDVSTITGMRMPMQEISEMTKPKGIFLVCDGAQSTGMMQIDVKKMGLDTFATSGHKWLMGPKETGFIYVRKEIQDRISCMQTETGYKAYTGNMGTRNVANMNGLAEAIRFHKSLDPKKTETHNVNMAQYLQEKLRQLNGITLISPIDEKLHSGLSSITLDKKNSGELYSQTQKRNVIIKRLGNDILRFSTHVFNTKDDVDRLIIELKALI